MISTPRMPNVAPAPEPPTKDQAAEDAKLKEQDLARRAAGRQGTILTSSQGVTQQVQTRKTLLGG